MSLATTNDSLSMAQVLRPGRGAIADNPGAPFLAHESEEASEAATDQLGAGRIESQGGSGRIVAIDGLRGIAALLVVLFHLHGAVARTASDWLWSPLDALARNGFLGVEIFFVISGYVIALSVSKGAPTLRYLGRFILRRSIRLDPPYWFGILLEVLLVFLTLRYFSGYPAVMPTPHQLLAHLVYAQELLGYGSIVDIYWTLSYEIQFYLFFVGLVVIFWHLPAPLQKRRWPALFCTGLFLLSVWTRYWPPAWLPHGLAINRWFQFFLGVLAWRAAERRDDLGPILVSCLVVSAAIIASGAALTQLMVIGVVAVLLGIARSQRIGRVLAIRPLAILGTLSYSIYLYHASIGWRFVSLVQRLVPGPWSPVIAICVFLSATVVSIGFAGVMWWFIERPCLTLCRLVTLPRRQSERPAFVAALGGGTSGATD